jgi:predicted Zn-dependent protease
MRTTAMRPDEESQNLARVRAKLEAGTSLEPLRAAESFRRRLVREPDRMDWRYGMALSQRYAGQLAEAEAGLSQLLTGNPRDPYLLRERGLTRLERGDLSHAEQDFRQALQHLPDNADLQYRLAFTLHEAGDATQATRLLYRLTSAHPTLDHAYYLLGLVEGEQGRLGYSHLALARHHRLKMDMDTASWHYDQALKHFPVDGRERKQVRREMALLKQQILERQRDQ